MLENRHRSVILKIGLILLLVLVSKVETIGAADDVTLKTLFYSSKERREIDLVRFRTGRHSKKMNKNSSDPGDGGLGRGGETEESVETIVIEGFVKREDGKNVIWYNNTSTLDDNKVNTNLKFKPRSIVNNRINIISNNKRIKLKPGQVLQVLSGKIQDQYKLRDSAAKLKIEKQ